MAFFNTFLSASAFILSGLSLVILYLLIRRCKDPTIIPIYYFIGLSFGSVLLLSVSRILDILLVEGIITSTLTRDLAAAYTALFLFGALWQSYEASVVEKPDWLD